jgi:tripartite-type tricarboxylate transporter receptor subunit TctC
MGVRHQEPRFSGEKALKVKNYFFAFWLLLGAALCSSPQLSAAEFPEHPVHLVVGYPPGGGADLIARVIAASLAAKIGQPVVVDNRPGAGTFIAGDYVSHSPADGYTLLLYGQPLTLPQEAKLSFDPLKGFSPIVLLAEQPGMLVVKSSLSVKSLKDFVALVKSKPGQLNYGSTGSDSLVSKMMKLIIKKTGMDLAEIPYTGEARVLTAMLGDEVQIGIMNASTAMPQIKSGDIKALAVTSKRHSPMAPDVPSVAEAVDYPEFDNALWYGVAGPAGLPPAVLSKLHDSLMAVIADPTVVKSLSDQGLIIIGSSPEDFTKKITDNIALWSGVEK